MLHEKLTEIVSSPCSWTEKLWDKAVNDKKNQIRFFHSCSTTYQCHTRTRRRIYENGRYHQRGGNRTSTSSCWVLWRPVGCCIGGAFSPFCCHFPCRCPCCGRRLQQHHLHRRLRLNSSSDTTRSWPMIGHPRRAIATDALPREEKTIRRRSHPPGYGLRGSQREKNTNRVGKDRQRLSNFPDVLVSDQES